MNWEDLIEKAFGAHEGAPTWEENPVGRDAAIRWHMRGFNDALTVCEAASLSVSDGSVTDTDPDHSELLANVASSDEQEALLRTIINAPESGDALHVAEAKRVRDAVLAAGFHRTVQGGPTDATLVIMAQAFYSATSGPGIGIHYDSMMVKPEIMEGIRVALRAAHLQVEVVYPQGEPTDAQVLAAQSALLSDIGWVRYSYVRNALRAAAQAHQEG